MDTNSFKNVLDARETCRSLGGVLATPRSQTDLDFIRNNFNVDWILIDGVRAQLKGFERLLGRIKFHYEDGSEFRLADALPWELDSCKSKRCGILLRGAQFTICDANDKNIYVCQMRSGTLQPHISFTTQASDPEPFRQDQFVSRGEMETVLRRMEWMATQIENLKNHLNTRNNSMSDGSHADFSELELRNGFTSSLQLHIGGKPTRMGFRLSFVNNLTGDIAFQLRVDFSKRIVSRTSYINGDWGATELVDSHLIWTSISLW